MNKDGSRRSQDQRCSELPLYNISGIMVGMKDWPDPDNDSGSGYLILIEYWVLAVAMIVGAVGGFLPALFRLLRQ